MRSCFRRVVLIAILQFVLEQMHYTIHSKTEPKDMNFNVEITVSLIEVTATVTDEWGRTVHDLDKDDFIIFENNVKQDIIHFQNARGLPKRVITLLDVSGSMRILNKIGAAKKAVQAFIDSLNRDDQICLIAFADGELEVIAEYSNNHRAILDKMWGVPAYGQTALRDAIKEAPRLGKAHGFYQRALLLITDGVDNASTVTIEEAIEAARKVDLPIYIIGIDPVGIRKTQNDKERQMAIEGMRTLAHETGGRFFHIGKTVEIYSGLDTLKKDMENQYLFTFQSNSTRVGAKHEIEVKTRKSRYKVRSRKGYFLDPSK